MRPKRAAHIDCMQWHCALHAVEPAVCGACRFCWIAAQKEEYTHFLIPNDLHAVCWSSSHVMGPHRWIGDFFTTSTLHHAAEHELKVFVSNPFVYAHLQDLFYPAAPSSDQWRVIGTGLQERSTYGMPDRSTNGGVHVERSAVVHGKHSLRRCHSVVNCPFEPLPCHGTSSGKRSSIDPPRCCIRCRNFLDEQTSSPVYRHLAANITSNEGFRLVVYDDVLR